MKTTIIVDMQNDFIDGVLGSREAKAIVPGIVEEIRRHPCDAYILTQDTHHRGGFLRSIESAVLPEHCVSRTEGWNLNTAIAEAIGNTGKNFRIVPKATFSGNDELIRAVQENLDNDGTDSVTIYGLCTDICVVSIALALRSAFPALPIEVRSDLCAGTSKENHEAALKVMRSCLIGVACRGSLKAMREALAGLGFIGCENDIWTRGKQHVRLFENMVAVVNDGASETNGWGYEYTLIRDDGIYTRIAGSEPKRIVGREE